ncbi:ATP-binding cassette domain-containing protein [Paracoccaceae bacterium Fryx2]|nr:ATP-binding cassette domain-containing protein [Paracoccaceae bacterium Fryx2]
MLGLTGENGAGKSTLIRSLARIGTATAATVGWMARPCGRGEGVAAEAAGLRFLRRRIAAAARPVGGGNMLLARPCPTRLGLVAWRKLRSPAAGWCGDARWARGDSARLEPGVDPG